MNRIRYLVAGLLCVTGAVHVARLGIPRVDATFDAGVVLLGVTYLLTGVFLFRGSRSACYFGAILPLIGLCAGLLGGMAGMLASPSAWMAFLGAVDVAIVLGSFYLVRRNQSP